ncbi:hypothetical protein PAERUG_P45_London_17_VIM_2_12_12_04137 [Pseudomonas aeruginosa]|nr:hypothetical protein PAERUG_E5_London_17_VIM_2_12_12_04352 [Pseudomonas aeruginosa]CRR42052.1 hypothetical protein PAERUG_P45_London_17_VIM_2_12_12_04137 [Pseudomonas aeruginosa]VTQ25571.1 Uncharacterised protein [Pseudomonas aeruginosa]
MPCGKLCFSSAIFSRTRLEISMAFEPGRWKIGIATAGLLFSSERRAYWLEPSSTRAMSRRRVISPLAPARMMMFSNSSSVTRRPWVLIDNWKLVSLGAGGAPRVPAATWRFCSRMALTTSVAVRLREATLFGSSQTRSE